MTKPMLPLFFENGRSGIVHRGMNRIELHPHIREWCVNELGYDPHFAGTYIPFDHNDRTLYDRYARDENGYRYTVYHADFNSDEDRDRFRKKWEFYLEGVIE